MNIVSYHKRILSNRINTTLLLTILLALCFRFAMYGIYAHQDHFLGMQLSYASFAHSITENEGYKACLSEDGIRYQENANTLIPLDRMASHLTENCTTPSAYYMPAYSYLVASIWGITGIQDYDIVIFFQIILDGVLGPLLIFLLLRNVGRRKAGLYAAVLYALCYNFARLNAGFLPDGLIPILSLVTIFPIVFYIETKPVLGACLTGLAVAFAALFRAEFNGWLLILVVGLPFLATISLNVKLRMTAVLLVSWALMNIPVSLFYEQIYGQFTFTRPGIGIQVWSVLGDYPDNPWGIMRPEGGNLDQTAATLLEENGLGFGSFEGDRFLLKEALLLIKEKPIDYARIILRHTSDMLFPNGYWMIVILYITAILGFFNFRKRSLFTSLFFLFWASRWLPATFLFSSDRILVPLFIVIIAGTAMVIDDGIDHLRHEIVLKSKQFPPELAPGLDGSSPFEEPNSQV